MQKEVWDNISKRYYSEILSPIKNSSENYLENDLSSLENSKEKKIIDLGCGIGEIEKFLSKNFKEVYAVDFSEGMINKAMNRNKNLDNVRFEVRDMTDMEDLKDEYDVALSVNSIITPDISSINKIFRNIFNLLKKKGKFFCVLPAMEVYAYQSLLIAEKESKKNKDYDKVSEIVEESIPENEHDFRLGMTNFLGRMSLQ